MVLANVIPGTKLPIDHAQAFTYSFRDTPLPGQVVAISLGNRKLTGVVADSTSIKLPRFHVKAASLAAGNIPTHNVLLAQDLADHYRVSLGLAIKLMLPPASTRSRAKPAKESITTRELPSLNSEQAVAFEKILKTFGQAKTFLLHGVTGSGKTEIYAHLIKRMLKQGQQVLFLVPEIAMTGHMSKRLEQYFGDRLLVWHSGMPQNKRRDAWQKLASGRPGLVLGPRSALFLPCSKLGLIIIDEEHDASFKQWDQEPRFHARAVASMLSHRVKCPLVLGSATPSLETMHQVGRGLIDKLKLEQRFGGSQMPNLEIIDTRGQPPQELLSPASTDAIRAALEDSLQIMILINRRGYAPLVLCGDCGHTWRCSKCDRTMVVHGRPVAQLRCHYCSLDSAYPKACPQCKSLSLKRIGRGTQRVQSELKLMFPESKVERLDADISKSSKRVKELAQNLQKGAIDILIGTQLVAKGWDLDRLHLVVVLDADMGLLIPDFRSHERTAQLLWQVAGRAGRRSKRGQVLIETSQPEHATLNAVATSNYDAFVNSELMERKAYGLPPHRRIMKVIIAGRSIDERSKKTNQIQSTIKKFMKKNPQIARTSELLPAIEHILPRGNVVTHLSILCLDPRVFYSILPLDVTIDVDPENIA